MALANPRTVFGIHNWTPYSRSTGIPYGTSKVTKGGELSLSGETVQLFGGSSAYNWDVQDGKITSELTLKASSYENWMVELFLGKAPTDGAAEAAGNCSALTNVKGTTTMVATTGIATATVTTAADLKSGKYVVKAMSASTVVVFGYSDIDFANGTDLSFKDNTLEITSAALTITTGSAVVIPGTGVSLTGGSGTIALVSGDTASFDVRPISSDYMEVVIGSTVDVYNEFGCYLVAKKKGNAAIFAIDVYRAKAIGMPILLNENAFSEFEVKAIAMYDSAKDGVMKITEVVPSR